MIDTSKSQWNAEYADVFPGGWALSNDLKLRRKLIYPNRGYSITHSYAPIR